MAIVMQHCLEHRVTDARAVTDLHIWARFLQRNLSVPRTAATNQCPRTPGGRESERLATAAWRE